MPVNWMITGGIFTTFSSPNTVTFTADTTGFPMLKPPPECACGSRRDRHWKHEEDGCTWISADGGVPLAA